MDMTPCASCTQSTALEAAAPAVHALLLHLQAAGIQARLQAHLSMRRCTCSRLAVRTLGIDTATKPYEEPS